jgi:hypothetical protein
MASVCVLILAFIAFLPSTSWASSTEELLSSLSLPQLVGQLTQCQLQRILTDDNLSVDPVKLQEHVLVGHFFDLPNSDPSIALGHFTSASFGSLSREALAETLSIPSSLLPTFGLDSVHGVRMVPAHNTISRLPRSTRRPTRRPTHSLATTRTQGKLHPFCSSLPAQPRIGIILPSNKRLQ